MNHHQEIIKELKRSKRLPIQVLVIPYYRNKNGDLEYLILKRQDLKVWQWVAGGVEFGENSKIAAYRESCE